MAKKAHNNEDSKIWAFLGVFLTVVGFLIVLLTRKEDKYAMYYAKLGLVLFIGWVIIALLERIPVIGLFIYIIGGILLLVLWIMAFIGAFSGEEKRFVIISDIADKIKI
ncbi:hypothetical protein HZA98_01325 [Candidatus Woesearchaeota archaeon]|nr:hypothetical protein [Candidatus Woesearchaeota archaeon]